MSFWDLLQNLGAGAGTAGGTIAATIYARFRAAETNAKKALDVAETTNKVVTEMRASQMAAQATAQTTLENEIRKRVDDYLRERSRSYSPMQTYAVRPERQQAVEMIRQIFEESIRPGIKLDWLSFLDNAREVLKHEVERAERSSQNDFPTFERLNRLERRMDELEADRKRDIESRMTQWRDIHELVGEMRSIVNQWNRRG